MWWVKCLTIGAAGGLIGGLLGVGGGIIMVPLLMIFMRLDIHDAKAISLAVICVVSLSGTIAHGKLGRLSGREWEMVAVAGLAAVVGSPVGAALAEKVDRQTLLRLFAIMLLVTGIKYLLPSKPAPDPAPAAQVAER